MVKRKIMIFICTICMLLMAAPCFAEIPPEEVSLGGITLRDKPEYVKQVYGEPSSYDPHGTDSVIYNYNGTFKIMFASGKYMYWIETTANNGIATPSGVTVGMNESVLNQYGDTYYDKYEHGINYKAFWARGRILLIFGIENGKIISIKARC